MTLKHVYHVKLCNDESLEQPTTNTPDRPGAPRHILKFLILSLLFASVLQ